MVPRLQPPPPDVYIIGPHCPHCGRPERPAALVHGPTGPTHLPELFCSSPRPLSATCRAEVVERLSSDVAGVLVPHADPVSLTTGDQSCFSSAVVPVAPEGMLAKARVHRRQTKQSAEEDVARQWPTRP